MRLFVRGERCEYAQAFRARIANFDVDDHSASANAVSHAAS